MSVLLLIIAAIVLLYLGTGGNTAAIALGLAALFGMYLDNWHFASILFGALSLAAALFLLIPSSLRKQELSRPLLGWVRGMLDGPVDQLCAMLDDWRITHEDYDLPEPVWQFIRDNGFFGLVIPKDFGGKGFSQRAHSEIVMKISTRSVSAAVTVMVPNSLGPGSC